MVLFYTVGERLLKEVKTKSSFGDVHITIFQRYISFIAPGPLMPASIQEARVETQDGEEIPLHQWDADLRQQVKEAKAGIPFQISLFRNLFIFIALLVALGIFNRYRLAQKNQETTNLTQRIEDIKAGDIFRVVFYKEDFSKMGLIQVTAISGDTIKFVRSLETQEATFKERDKHLPFTEYTNTEETASVSLLKKSGHDQSIVSFIPDRLGGGGIAKIIGVQN